MKVAFYGRYSSDNQRDTSIADQRRIVERWAERHAHEIVADYADSAISGASLHALKGLQEALRRACTRPSPFDVIAVDQLSRLSRDIGDTDAIVKRLKFFGLRIVAVSDGLDTSDETTKISVTVKSLVNELYLDDLRKTTKRGLDGQFLKGYSTGGRTYGFRSEPVLDRSGATDARGNPSSIGCRMTVVPEEAEVVRQMFRLFCDGHGEKSIAAGAELAAQHDLLDAPELEVRRAFLLQSPTVAEGSCDRPKSLSLALSRAMGADHERRPPHRR